MKKNVYEWIANHDLAKALSDRAVDFEADTNRDEATQSATIVAPTTNLSNGTRAPQMTKQLLGSTTLWT